MAPIPEIKTVFVDEASATKISVDVGYGDKDRRKRGWKQINAGIEARPAVIPDVQVLVLAQGGHRDISMNVLGDTEAAASFGVVADARPAGGPSIIGRYDGRYSVAVQAGLANEVVLGTANAAIAALPATRNMPDGASLQPSGDAEFINEIFSTAFPSQMAPIRRVQ